MNIYYLGLAEKTVQYTKFFKDKIVVKSKHKPTLPTMEDIAGRKIDYNAEEDFAKISNFFSDMISKVCAVDNSALFIPYNQGTVCLIKNRERIICVNDFNLLDNLNDKPKSRDILKETVTLLEYKYLAGKDITFEKINSLFNNSSKKYVVQEFSSFGGFGAFLLSKDNAQIILPKINKNHTYSISKYMENNIPINNTFLITKDNIAILDGSIQNIIIKDELLYDGWDFEKYNKLNKDLKEKIYTQTYKIAEKLQKLGYIGIGGVDYIVANDTVYFMEINPRFQASSEYLDKKLQDRGLPSLFELQYQCFFAPQQFANFCNKIKQNNKK